MNGWEEQIIALHSSFSYRDILQTTLVDIDKKIISEESIFNIMRIGYTRILDLTGAEYAIFHIGEEDINLTEKKDINDKNEYNRILIKIDTEETEWKRYIDSVTLYFKDSNGLARREGVDSITRQLNIAILRDVERGIDSLYRIVIKRFSKLGDIYNVFDLFCKEITNIFPNVTGDERFDIENLCIQVAIFENEEKGFEKGGILKGVGSTDKYLHGSYIDGGNSITGKIFPMIKKSTIEDDFHIIRHEDQKYIYYLGDPSKSKYYRKVTISRSKSQLSVPLFMKKSSGKYFPFAVVVLESNEENKFKNIHAKSLLFNAERLAELINSVWRIAQGRRYIVEGFFQNKDKYVKNILDEHEHRSGHTFLSLSRLSHSIKEKESYEIIAANVKEAYDKMKVDNNILKDSLSGVAHKQEYICLEDDVLKAKRYIQGLLDQEDILLETNISNIGKLYLDNLFPQYLYSLFYNSIGSIVAKKNRLRTVSKGKEVDYKPKIEIIAAPQPMLESVNKKKLRCKIIIKDNGDGIEKEKIKHLARHRRSFTGGTGTGLYSFKQYLLIHEARVYFDSVLHESFSVEFIVDMTK